MNEPTIKEALDASANAIKGGDLETGKAGLKWVLEREPDNVLAWLWMSRCTESSEEKLECFNRVLAVDPTNRHAREGIMRFGEREKGQESLGGILQRIRITLAKKQNARAVLIVVVIAFIALILVVGPGARVGGGGDGGVGNNVSRPDVDDPVWDKYFGCLAIQRDWGG